MYKGLLPARGGDGGKSGGCIIFSNRGRRGPTKGVIATNLKVAVL